MNLGLGHAPSRLPPPAVGTSATPAAVANLLRNPAFEQTEALGGAFRRPLHWAASAFSPACGAVTTACPAALTPRRTGRGTSVAWVSDSLPSAGEAGRPATLHQTLRLAPGAYRFGGRIALRVWDAALDDGRRRVLNESQAFLRLARVAGSADDGGDLPAGRQGRVLGAIDLSPRRFAYAAFRRVPSVGATASFAYLGFDTHECVVRVDGDGPADVTLQLGVAPCAPAGGLAAERLVALTHTTVVADYLFVEPA